MRTAVDVVAGMVEVTVVVTHANSNAVELLELEWVVVLLEELVVDELEDECVVVVDDGDVEVVDEEELLV